MMITVNVAFIFLLVNSCVLERPGVGSEDYKRPKFSHSMVTTDCSSCHEVHRPGPDADGTPHGGGGDCTSCHKSSDTREGWLPPLFFSHNPAPESCVRCHESDRPPPDHVQS